MTFKMLKKKISSLCHIFQCVLVPRAKTFVLLEINVGMIITFTAITVINNKEDFYRNESKEAPAMLTYMKLFVI